MTYLRIFLTLLLICIFESINCQNFRVDGRYIYNNERPFTALGINYSPIPIGASQAYPDSDLGDMYGNEWGRLHERDIPLMRNMGINSIRVYNWYPWKYPSADQPEYVEELGNNHTNILNMLWNDGVDPIYIWIPYHIPIPFHYKISATKPIDRESWRLRNGEWAYADPEWEEEDEALRQIIKNAYRATAEHYGDHPAAIGFVLGNENNDENTRGNPLFWKFLNEIGEMIKEIAPNKLTMVAVVDDGHLTVQAAEAIGLMDYIDVWGINSYRGTVDQGFDVLFTHFATLSNRPILVTEYGPPASTRNEAGEAIILADNAQAQADYIRVHFEDIIAHRSICSGGYIFEYVDEWWKNTDPNNQDPNVSPNPAYPGGEGDEEYFGIFGVRITEGLPEDFKTRPADTLEPRAAVQTITEMFHNFDPDDIPPQEDPAPMAPIEPYEPFVSPSEPVEIPEAPPKKPPSAEPGSDSPETESPELEVPIEPEVSPEDQNEPVKEQDGPELNKPIGESKGNSFNSERKFFLIITFLVGFLAYK